VFALRRAMHRTRFREESREKLLLDGASLVTVLLAASASALTAPATVTLATSVPAHAQVIDGQGHTLVPGLWDSHMHIQGDASGPLLLALGITSTRDPGNDDELTLTGALHRAGVRVVAGTDGSGLERVREHELYVQAGFTNEEALATATIEAARNVGVDERTGSIGVGKAADLVLVEGDPSHDIGTLRNTRLVMMDGRLMDADALRTAAGISGRPHPAAH